MNAISFKAHAPLSESDITRLPQAASTVAAAPAATVAAPEGDTYGEPKKMSSATKTLIGLAVVAGSLVALKRFTGLLKVAPDATGTMSKIKGYVAKAADYVEYPFVKTYNFVKGLFGKKAADAGAGAAGVDAGTTAGA